MDVRISQSAFNSFSFYKIAMKLVFFNWYQDNSFNLSLNCVVLHSDINWSFCVSIATYGELSLSLPKRATFVTPSLCVTKNVPPKSSNFFGKKLPQSTQISEGVLQNFIPSLPVPPYSLVSPNPVPAPFSCSLLSSSPPFFMPQSHHFILENSADVSLKISLLAFLKWLSICCFFILSHLRCTATGITVFHAFFPASNFWRQTLLHLLLIIFVLCISSYSFLSCSSSLPSFAFNTALLPLFMELTRVVKLESCEYTYSAESVFFFN